MSDQKTWIQKLITEKGGDPKKTVVVSDDAKSPSKGFRKQYQQDKDKNKEKDGK